MCRQLASSRALERTSGGSRTLLVSRCVLMQQRPPVGHPPADAGGRRVHTRWQTNTRGRAVPGRRPRGAGGRPPVCHAPAVGYLWGRVLVIDDEPPLRLVYRLNLEEHGIEVMEAADGLTGIRRAESESPDRILFDVMMRGLDGWTVAEELRNNPKTDHIPVVFVTPRPAPRDRLRGLGLGAVDYIALPHHPAKLASRVCA